MADWNQLGQFGTGEANVINFEYRVLSTNQHPATLKRKLGATLINTSIIASSQTDTDIELEIYFHGTKKPYINSSLTLDQEEARLLALDDQLKHNLELGKYSGDYILSGLVEDIEFNNNHTEIRKFKCVFLQRQL